MGHSIDFFKDEIRNGLRDRGGHSRRMGYIGWKSIFGYDLFKKYLVAAAPQTDVCIWNLEFILQAGAI